MQRLCSQAGPDPRGNGGSGCTRSSLLFWAQDFCAGRKWRLLTLPIKRIPLYPSWILLKMNVFIKDVVKSKLGYIMKEEQVVAVKAILEGKDIFVVLPTGYGKSLISILISGSNQNLIKSIGHLSCCYRHYPLASWVSVELRNSVCTAYSKLINHQHSLATLIFLYKVASSTFQLPLCNVLRVASVFGVTSDIFATSNTKQSAHGYCMGGASNHY